MTKVIAISEPVVIKKKKQHPVSQFIITCVKISLTKLSDYCGKIMVEKQEKIGSVKSCLTDVPQVGFYLVLDVWSIEDHIQT